MTSEMQGTQGMMGPDEFDGLLADVLRTMANPEMPERARVQVRTRVWVNEMKEPMSQDREMDHPGVETDQPMSQNRDMGHPTLELAGGGVVVAPSVFVDFQRRMNPKRSTASTWFAVGAHAAAIALIFWLAAAKMHSVSLTNTAAVTELAPPPPITEMKKDVMGGGGGQKSPTPVSKGQLPKFADTQITPPAPPPLAEPKIKMPDPAIEVQKDLKMANNNMPNIGMPNSPLMGASLGNGIGTGIGSGYGSGLGAGSGGNYGGGVKRIGGGVSAPQVLFAPDPEFSEEARKAKFMGVVTVNLIVDAQGRPQNVHVVRGVGMGLDEKAKEAVLQYKFKPATEGGKPVAVELNIEVKLSDLLKAASQQVGKVSPTC